jgi:AcrR family transcriptional regulator
MNSPKPTDYQHARERGQQLLTETLLALATDIIVTEGAGALSMRRLAQAAGCSTTVLYNLFGAKNGVIDALFIDGFRRLAEAQAALSVVDDPRQRVIDLCLTYRQVALSYPTHYAIMFGNAVPDYTPSQASKQVALNAMDSLQQAVMAMDASLLGGVSAEQLAMILWSVAHGFVSLELAGMNPMPERAEELYLAALRRIMP